ncbi:HupE/UreJ family protein [Radicibacter daui]|uniref:HupE/UreJ family protein n=1 Tax=Radicibacter daui TaxID=3064829 RepID=UPI0040469BC2
MKLKSALGIASLVAGLLPAAAFAHTGVGQASGFGQGFAHPITGLDHVLAMVMVGVFAWQLGGRALWLVPMVFVAVMGLGGGLGMAGIAVPYVEVGIALSVIVLGGVVALGLKAPTAVAMAVVGLFALFHGHAHGAEMPEDAAGVAYGMGFMLATALLHAAGLGLGITVGKAGERRGAAVVRAAGGIAAAAGVGLLAGMF